MTIYNHVLGMFYLFQLFSHENVRVTRASDAPVSLNVTPSAWLRAANSRCSEAACKVRETK